MSQIFKYPNHYIYMVIPIIVLLILVLGRRKKAGILTKMRLNLTMKYEKIRIVIIVVSLVLLCIALLGPQKLTGTMEVKRERLDIYVLLDTSKSMLVEDTLPNRLEREKQIVHHILASLDGDRIGFIPFSSSAYIQMPLTDDYNMAKMFLDVVDTDMIGGGGSDVGKAIKLAFDSFERTTLGDKVILIISDGEEHDKESEEALKAIMDDQLKVYAIGVGTSEGGLIPIYNETGQVTDYKKDKNGNPIMSKLNDATLKGLAKIGHGAYYASTMDAHEVNAFLSSIASLKKDGNTTKEINQYQQLYPYFLGMGLSLFLIAYLVPVRRQKI